MYIGNLAGNIRNKVAKATEKIPSADSIKTKVAAATANVPSAASLTEKAHNVVKNVVNKTTSNDPNAVIKNTANISNTTTATQNTGGNSTGAGAPGAPRGVRAGMTPERMQAMRTKMQERRAAFMERMKGMRGRQPRIGRMTSGGFMRRRSAPATAPVE